MSKDIKLENAHILFGDALARLKELPDNSVDSIVTDPPYGLSDNKHVASTIEKWITGERDFIPDGKGFMGKAWDSFVPPPAIWDECLRVLKPGGHLLAFFGSRTQDIGALSIRLAGFEIRDSIAWVYGSGFPKSMDISKSIDKMPPASERKILDSFKRSGRSGGILGKVTEITRNITEPSKDEAKQYAGWGTALKPAVEPIVVARKPLSESTVANNVLKWGTGGLNIDASRVGTETITQNQSTLAGMQGGRGGSSQATGVPSRSNGVTTQTTGRFPANIILDEAAASMLDEQSGVSKSTGGSINKGGLKSWVSSLNAEDKSSSFNEAGNAGFGDTGGASRFFYVAKASKKDRNEGMSESTNIHPTVKPTKLMEYLIKLVTPVGGTVLDPFTGSGSTGKAALLNGFKFVGCELTEEYLPIIEGRLTWAEKKHAEEIALKEKEEAETLFPTEGE
jgi:site-specific DNA-methyltransferase (adenine-specific)